MIVRTRSQIGRSFGRLLLTSVLASAILLATQPVLAQPTPAADITIRKGDNPDPVSTGEPLIYRLVVENRGPDPAAGVVVTDILPPSVRLLELPGGCSTAGNAVSCRVGDLDIDDAFFVFFAVVPTEPGTITNTATVSSPTPDPDPSNNTVTETTIVLGPPADPQQGGQDGVADVVQEEPEQEVESGDVEQDFAVV